MPYSAQIILTPSSTLAKVDLELEAIINERKQHRRELEELDLELTFVGHVKADLLKFVFCDSKIIGIYHPTKIAERMDFCGQRYVTLETIPSIAPIVAKQKICTLRINDATPVHLSNLFGSLHRHPATTKLILKTKSANKYSKDSLAELAGSLRMSKVAELEIIGDEELGNYLQIQLKHLRISSQPYAEEKESEPLERSNTVVLDPSLFNTSEKAADLDKDKKADAVSDQPPVTTSPATVRGGLNRGPYNLRAKRKFHEVKKAKDEAPTLTPAQKPIHLCI